MTLIEMLVVLAIIGIAAGATVLGLGVATRKVSTQAEAQRLASRIRLAADDAMVTDEPVTFTWDADHYSFAGGDGNKASFAPHAMPRGITLNIAGSARSIQLGADGGGEPIRARLKSDADVWMVNYDGLSVTAAPLGPS